MIAAASSSASLGATPRAAARRRRATPSAAPSVHNLSKRRPSTRAAATAGGDRGNATTNPAAADALTALARAPLALLEVATGGTDPILRAAAKEPAAFLGGAFAALLQLDESRDPLREWIERTREAAGLDPVPPPSDI
jgi:hypothetical protein